jgi:hypothetical protein
MGLNAGGCKPRQTIVADVARVLRSLARGGAAAAVDAWVRAPALLLPAPQLADGENAVPKLPVGIIEAPALTPYSSPRMDPQRDGEGAAGAERSQFVIEVPNGDANRIRGLLSVAAVA